MFHSEHGLMSFECRSKKMKAMPRIDCEGFMCGANFSEVKNWICCIFQFLLQR
ncbi:hypothetical protein JHK82_021909 [Glycine max]|uniref:DUF3700 domain-containing protein n=1 Tax=Glycine max TaxID=3847 RepID=K7L7T0_SOYBN|nr:hypothetical protein JHK85_022374 [Glycine max]KAG5137178.1 hypothetical protein JHK82_021909 [Glycine max]KAH1052179.1 hypothetical protein GYH30_021835 [Glycine max]KRH44300.1 hypothetical protein GLYMA_08G202500v4 [Glycine max]